MQWTASGLRTHSLVLPSSQVPAVCAEVLSKRRLDGLTYAVRSLGWRRLWLDSEIIITAPPGVLESTKQQIEQWRFEDWGDRQW